MHQSSILGRMLVVLLMVANTSLSQWSKDPAGWLIVISNGQNLLAAGSSSAQRSSDGGKTWNPIELPCSYVYVRSAAFSNNNICIYTDCGSFLSTDNGGTWTKSSEIPYAEKMTSIGSYIYASIGKTIYVSSNGGVNWFTRSIPSTFDFSISSNYVAKGSNIFVAAGPNIFHTTDNGNTWSEIIKSGLPFAGYPGIKALAFVGDNLFAGMDGQAWVPPNNTKYYSGLYMSTDLGTTWTINPILAAAKISTLLAIGDKLIVGGWPNIFRVDGDGSNELCLSGDVISNYDVYSMCVSGDNLFVGNSGGLWHRLIEDVVANIEDDHESVPSHFHLEQNFPNPFNPSTTISFSIPQSCAVSLKVYSILGAEVATLVSEVLPAGEHKIVFDTDKLSSGTYYYRLHSDSYAETKKFILLK